MATLSACLYTLHDAFPSKNIRISCFIAARSVYNGLYNLLLYKWKKITRHLSSSFERTYLWSCIICMPLYYYFYRNIIGEIFHLIAIMQWTAEHRLDCGQPFFSPTLCYIIYTPGLLLMLIPVKLPSSTKGWGHLNRLYWIAKIYYINMF